MAVTASLYQFTFPTSDGYFEHSLEVLKLCLESLRITATDKVSITIVSNESTPAVIDELRRRFEEGWIDQLLLNQQNRGKVDGVISAARGAHEDFITISDCDVLFKPGWLEAIEDLFSNFPECGSASPVPDPNHEWYYTSATVLGGSVRKELALKKVVSDEDLDRLAQSVKRQRLCSVERQNAQVVVKRNGAAACVGCGHLIFTMRKEVIPAIPKQPVLKFAKAEEFYFDKPPDALGFWRLSTTQAYPYHMGNVPEAWMFEELEHIDEQ